MVPAQLCIIVLFTSFPTCRWPLVEVENVESHDQAVCWWSGQTHPSAMELAGSQGCHLERPCLLTKGLHVPLELLFFFVAVILIFKIPKRVSIEVLFPDITDKKHGYRYQIAKWACLKTQLTRPWPDSLHGPKQILVEGKLWKTLTFLQVWRHCFNQNGSL